MRHGQCYSTDTAVYNKRPSNGTIWRRRKCRKCLQRFTTREITDEEYKKLMSETKPVNELEQPVWAVISADRVEASGVTYAEAVAIIKETMSPDLMITTADAADRLAARRAAA